MKLKNDQIVIIDGYGFLFRAYHSMPPLTNPDGIPVGAVYGFTSMLMRVLKDANPSHVVVVFDVGKKNFRHYIYPEYKANRPEPPDDLRPQFPLVREAVQALNIKILEIEGYEADDIIATLAKMALKNKEEVLIVSSDKDLMQLINGHTRMYDAIRNKLIGEKEVEEKWGVKPELMLDLLAMIGDSSDNIPGLPGIGPKTAALLLKEYGSWQNVYQSANNIKQSKRRQIIESGGKIVELSKSLIKLYDDLELNITFNDLQAKPVEAVSLISFLQKHNFRSLIARAKKDLNLGSEETSKLVNKFIEQTSRQKNTDCIKINNNQQLERFIDKLSTQYKVSICLQTNFKNRNEVRELTDIYAIIIGCDSYSGYVLIGDSSSEKQKNFLDIQESEGFALEYVFLKLNNLLEDNGIKKIIYDVKSFIHILDKFGLTDSFNSYEDIMLMAYSSGSGRMIYDFENISKYYLEENDDFLDIGGITRSRKKLLESDKKILDQYFGSKAHNLLELYNKLNYELVEHRKQTLYQKMELPLANVLFNMEKEGVRIDVNSLLSLSKKFEKILVGLEEEIYMLANQRFNIASPKQLSDILFNHMGIAPPKKSKSGLLSTGVEVLEQLKISGHTIADKILEWRSIHKLKTTYTDALPKQVNINTGRIHTYFAQAVTSTGRLSSSDPNLQNIPIKSELGQEIRNTFVARNGYKIISADYSQIELRILAHIANIDALKFAFQQGIDIHTATASEIFDVDLSNATKELRRKAKAINFGIIYGLSAFGLAKNIDISRAEAAIYIEKYFHKYPGIKQYMHNIVSYAKIHGFVETLMGRRCYIKYINDKNYSLRSFAERAAINAPIQGSNADFIKKAMNQIARDIGFSKEFKMILQVHDELLFEIIDEKVDFYKTKIIKIMEDIVKLTVPIKVGVFVGDSWKKL